MIIKIILIVLLINASVGNDSQPYWRENFFIEKELPKELRGKPIQYIDSVFSVKRNQKSLVVPVRGM